MPQRISIPRLNNLVIYQNIEAINMRKIKMILDTDIGDDIDDAFAFAVNHKDLDLIGITVFKHTK